MFALNAPRNTHGTKMIVLLLNGLVKPKMNNGKFTIIFGEYGVMDVLCMLQFYTAHKMGWFIVCSTREYGPR